MTVACFDFVTFSRRPTIGGIQRILFEIVSRWDDKRVTPVFLFDLDGDLLLLELEEVQQALAVLHPVKSELTSFHADWERQLRLSKHQLVTFPSLLLYVDVWFLAESTSELDVVQRLEEASRWIPCAAIIYDFLPQTHSDFFISTSSSVSFPYSFSLRKLSGAIAISQQSKLDFFRLLNLDPDDRVVVSSPGIDHVDPKSITFSHVIGNILILGKLEPRKQQLEILKALKNSLIASETIRIHLVGESVNLNYLNKIESFIQNEGLEHVVFISGMLGEKELEKLISQCQISISAGFEGYGLVPLEMLRLGLVVIDAGLTPSLDEITHPRLFKVDNLSSESVESALVQVRNFMNDETIEHGEMIDNLPTWQGFCNDIVELCAVLNSGGPRPFYV